VDLWGDGHPEAKFENMDAIEFGTIGCLLDADYFCKSIFIYIYISFVIETELSWVCFN
jgi:hypothetical protein